MWVCYREKVTGDRKQPSLCVVAVEDLWETLMGVHEQVCHGGRTRMEKYLVKHGSHVPRPVIQLFLDLYQICQATRGRKSTQKIVHKPIIPDAVGQRGQADLVDLQMVSDNGYKFILNYLRTVSASTSSCDHSRLRQQLRWRLSGEYLLRARPAQYPAHE